MSVQRHPKPDDVGRLILAVAVVLVVALVAIVVTRGRVTRPDLSEVPLPVGSVTHAAVEDCSGEGRRFCAVSLAVGPAGGVELPRSTEEMLAEHLRDRGWRPTQPPDERDPVLELISSDGRLLVRVAGYQVGRTPEGLDDRVDEDVDRGDLALVRVIPNETT